MQRTDTSTNGRSPLDLTMGILGDGTGAFGGQIGQVRLYKGAMTEAEGTAILTELRRYYNNQAPLTRADEYVLNEDASLFARRVVLRGTDGRNDLRFSACDANISARGGSDTMARSYDSFFESVFCPRFPMAYLNGGSGKDELEGTVGPDALIGGGGKDLLDGGSGADRLKGGNGPDVLKGKDGNDVLRGGGGNDQLLGGKGRDNLQGQAGQDRLYGGPSRDRADGGPSPKDLCRAEQKLRCER